MEDSNGSPCVSGRRRRAHEAAAFVAANPRLLDSRIMLEHYSAEVLFSPEARQSFVQPDVRAIPERG